MGGWRLESGTHFFSFLNLKKKNQQFTILISILSNTFFWVFHFKSNKNNIPNVFAKPFLIFHLGGVELIRHINT